MGLCRHRPVPFRHLPAPIWGRSRAVWAREDMPVGRVQAGMGSAGGGCVRAGGPVPAGRFGLTGGRVLPAGPFLSAIRPLIFWLLWAKAPYPHQTCPLGQGVPGRY